MSKTNSLEQRIAAALGNPTSSDELYPLITEAELAVNTAEEIAESERRKALDPIASPDATKAEQVAWAAELRLDRLTSSLPRLCQRLAEVERSEITARWETKYDALEAKRDALAKELAELYPKLSAQLCDLFRRAKAVDQECSRINAEAPGGEHRRLVGVELMARSLRSFGMGYPEIIGRVTLPDWTDSDRLAWPPSKTPLSVLVAEAMSPPHDARFSADWGAAREKENAQRAAVQARWEKEEEARQAASRSAYEASLRR